mmetsp:Transcript_95427/g.169418  ORF Transcript_95427/g.169418 Transcript_95427/m.169418 type:complete len:94 (-) Transcript_95427:359-640(-)
MTPHLLSARKQATARAAAWVWGHRAKLKGAKGIVQPQSRHSNRAALTAKQKTHPPPPTRHVLYAFAVAAPAAGFFLSSGLRRNRGGGSRTRRA